MDDALRVPRSSVMNKLAKLIDSISFTISSSIDSRKFFFFVEATIKFKENGGRSRVHAGFVPTQLRFFPSAPSSFHPDSGRDPAL